MSTKKVTPETKEAEVKQEPEVVQEQPKEEGGIEANAKYERKSSRQKKKAYNIEHITPIGDELQFETFAEKVENTLIELENAKRGGRILKGKVMGAVDEQYMNSYMVCASIIYNDCVRIIIPANLFFDARNMPKRTSEEEKLQRDRLFVNMRRDAEVEFKILAVNSEEGNQFAIGDRVSAMKFKREDDFLPKGDKPAFIKEGSIYESRVTFVADREMGIEIHGFETIIQNKDITYARLKSLKEKYRAGDTVPLRVKKVELQMENGKPVDVLRLDLDGKDIGGDSRDIAVSCIKEGMSVFGEVTQVAPDACYVRINNTDFYVRCAPPQFCSPMKSEEVHMVISHVDKDRKRIYGRITSTHGFKRKP